MNVIRFFLPKKPEPILFLPAMRSFNTFSLFFNFSREGSYFFGQSSKHLSADHHRCEHRDFYKVSSVGLVSYILADQRPRGELLTKQTSFFRATLCVTCENRITKIASPFSPATISLANLHETHVRARHLAIFKHHASEPIQDKLSRDKIADTIAAGAQGVSISQLYCTLYTYNFSPHI